LAGEFDKDNLTAKFHYRQLKILVKIFPVENFQKIKVKFVEKQ